MTKFLDINWNQTVVFLSYKMDIGVLDDFSPFLTKDEFKRVYRPSDDSFFLLRSIKEDIASFLP